MPTKFSIAPDFGCILAFEDRNNVINTSAILECCDGLFHMSDVTGDKTYEQRAIDSIDWVARRLYKGDGLFHDGYNPTTKQISEQRWKDKFGVPGRPLLDDGVLLLAWQKAGNEKCRRVFYEIADKLLAAEEPQGNWVNYQPCHWQSGTIHPRMAFWWGRPMWMAYKASKQEKYRECFERACDWYANAMRRDGGIIRRTFTDFSTESLGHATSGVGTACMMFHDDYVQLGGKKHLDKLSLGLDYIMSMQVTKAIDPNMQGVIIEKVLPPAGSDAASWYIRDLGTIFFVTSASQVLMNIKE